MILPAICEIFSHTCCMYEASREQLNPQNIIMINWLNAINDDEGGLTEFVIAGNEYLAEETASRIRFAHVLLVNNPNHDKGHGNLCRMSFYASIH